jgi:surface polysaccharide O-acyltransferase-like enzyme
MEEAVQRKVGSVRSPAGRLDVSPAGGGPSEMGNALDALRVATTIIVVLCHSALSYLATPLRVTFWPCYEPMGSSLFDIFIYWGNGFAMPVFFLAAGVSAPAACESRGPRAFLAHRSRRVLRPLLFGCFTILPIFYLVAGYALIVSGRTTIGDIRAWRFSPEIAHHLYGFGHLWFLEYLFLVCVLWCIGWQLHRLLPRARTAPESGDTWLQSMFASPWKRLWVAVPTAVIFLLDPDTMVRIDNGIVPNILRLLHYTLFFAVGAWIAKVRDPKQRFSRFGPTCLALSLVVYATMVPLILRHAATPLQGANRVIYCLLAALFPWLSIFGGLGALLRVVQSRGTVMRFLSEASFWVYLIHVPIVVFVQTLLFSFAWPAPVKFLVVFAAGFGLSLLSYVPLVRHSLIGVIINGARKRLPKGARLNPELGWVATACAIVLFVSGAIWTFRGFLFENNYHAVIPGRLYRSALLKPEALDDMIKRLDLRSIVTFNGSHERAWFTAQRLVSQSRGVQLHTIALRTGPSPRREALIQLIDILRSCPRPVLVQANHGIDQVGFAAAVDLLLGGSSPAVALGQFDLKYGQVGGPKRSSLAAILLRYQDWLAAHDQSHTPQSFQAWARDEKLSRPVPVLARDAKSWPAPSAVGTGFR